MMRGVFVAALMLLGACQRSECKSSPIPERLFAPDHDPALLYKPPIGPAYAAVDRCVLTNFKRLVRDTKDSADSVAQAVVDSCEDELANAQKVWDAKVGPTDPGPFENSLVGAVRSLVVSQRASGC